MKCTCEKKGCKICYQRNWRLKQSKEWKKRESEKMMVYNKQHPEVRERAVRKQICKILGKHAEDLKNDPERLSTKFMQKIIGIKCKREEL